MLVDIILAKPPVVHGAPPPQEPLGTIMTEAMPNLGMVINLGTDVLQVIAMGMLMGEFEGAEAAFSPTHFLRGHVVVTKVGTRPADGPLAMVTTPPQPAQGLPPAPGMNGGRRM